jgi:DNA-binding response OmpR family regulator
VDSNRRNIELMAQHLGREGYDVQGASSLQDLDHAIKGKKIALAIIDISGFDRSVAGRFDSGIWAHCQQLREAKIPFLIVSAQRSSTIQRESMKQGACGVLVKPIAIKELLEHIRALIG